jgi:peptidoglycan lytic transglycosylase G
VKRILIRLFLLAVVLAVAVAAAGYFGFTRVRESFKGYAGDEQFVEVPSGAGPATIGQRLVDAGIVRDTLTFRAALWLTGRARDLKAGEYRFDQPMSALDVVDKIARGDVYRRLVTFREGLTIKEMARVYEAAQLGRAEDFERAAKDTAAIRELDPDAPDLEGYLFPDTYSLRREIPASTLIAQMVASFKRAFTDELRAAAQARGLTVRQAVTLASLVEKETAVPEERPIVAAVYLNRRTSNMPMQADPTVIFAMQRAGNYNGNIRKEDLQIDSPYNTYRYPGLPPGPIASPGKASLEAAVNPAQVDYLYFVSKNDGSHVFARTLDEHNRNVQEWQVRFFRERRQQQQQTGTNSSPPR